MNTPRLYIFLRTDMASMTAGRAAAQAAHAQSNFEDHIRRQDKKSPARAAYANWRNEAGAFGTVIVLAVSGVAEINRALVAADDMNGVSHSPYLCGTVIDPEYAVVDGDCVHMIKDVLTGAYVFCDKSIGDIAYKDYILYNGPQYK